MAQNRSAALPWRVQQLEHDRDDLRSRVKELDNSKADADDVQGLRDEFRDLRSALIKFSLTIAGSAIVIAASVSLAAFQLS